MIIERLQELNTDQAKIIEKQSNQYDDYVNSSQVIKDTLMEKVFEIAELRLTIEEYKRKLDVYNKRDQVEDYIKKMGRRYIDPKTNLSWERLFYILYPSADEFEYHKRGKAKEAIKGLLRSHDLGFGDNGTIFRQH